MSDSSSMNAATTYRRLLRYARPHLLLFVFAVLAMIVVAGPNVLFANYNGEIVEHMNGVQPGNLEFVPWLGMGTHVVSAPNKSFLLFAPVILLGLIIIRALANFFASFLMSAIGRRVIYSLRDEMFRHLVLLPGRFYHEKTSGDIIARFIFNSEQIFVSVTSAVTTLIRDSVAALVLLAYLFYINFVVTMVFLVATPVVTYLLSLLSKRFRKLSQRIQTSMGDATTVLQEAIEGQEVVKTYGGQATEVDAFDRVNRKNRTQNIKLSATTAGGIALVEILAGATIAIILGMLISSGISAANFVAYFTAILLLLQSINKLTKVNPALQRGIAAAMTLFELLDEEKELDSGSRKLASVRGKIEFRHVSFGFAADKPVLHDVSFSAEPGKKIAIVGRSGSGKSTAIKLLPRFYELQQGKILIDDINIAELQLNELRKHIALVSQNIVLFDDTIANNIAYGSMQQATRADIEKAAAAAHVLEFVKDMDNGLDTLVGERGGRLSGGQKQRIAIARAILKNAPILILDEATSALDSESESLVQEGLDTLQQGRTTIVIAHRLSTIENSDLIVVMDQGRIVETGNHAELLRRNGFYAGYYNESKQQSSES